MSLIHWICRRRRRRRRCLRCSPISMVKTNESNEFLLLIQFWQKLFLFSFFAFYTRFPLVIFDYLWRNVLPQDSIHNWLCFFLWKFYAVTDVWRLHFDCSVFVPRLLPFRMINSWFSYKLKRKCMTMEYIVTKAERRRCEQKGNRIKKRISRCSRIK